MSLILRLNLLLLVTAINFLILPLHRSQDQIFYQLYFYQTSFLSINSHIHLLFIDSKFLRIKLLLKISSILSKHPHIYLSNLLSNNTCKRYSFLSSRFWLKSTFYAFSPNFTNFYFNWRLEYIINKALKSLILS